MECDLGLCFGLTLTLRPGHVHFPFQSSIMRKTLVSQILQTKVFLHTPLSFLGNERMSLGSEMNVKAHL